jgi:streptogramin lyase
VGGLPTDVTAGPGGVWVANQRDGTLTRVDPASGKVRGAAVTAVRSVNQVASGDGHVWAVSADGTVEGLDARTAQPPAPPVPLGVDAYDVAVGAGALWVANGNAGTLVRVPINGAVLSTADPGVPVGAGASGVAVGAGHVWAVSPDSGEVTWLDPRTGRRMGSRRLEPGVEDVAVAGSSAWVANPRQGQVLRLDAAGRIVERLRVPVTRGAALAAGNGTLAYLDLDTGVPVLIDPVTGRSRSLSSAGRGASSLAVASHKLWITYPRDDALAAVAF